MEISLVPKEHIERVWPNINAYAEKCAKYTYGRYTVADIYDVVKDGDNTLWIAFDEKSIKGAVVTDLVTYPKKKMLCMQFCGGEDLKEWKDPMLALLRKYAKDMGCEGIESTARRGWAKVFENDGYKPHWVTFELPLEAENNNG